VETLPTVTESEVSPVWSLKALAGIFEPDEPPEPPELAAVVVVDAELVELQAIAVVASTRTAPSAAKRVFRDVRVIFPPSCGARSGVSLPHQPGRFV
ncbi:MAG TPA: hypothetical protein VFC03_20260, partial [Acidimicrobiales bacterium]|nr:hypothetical protein [Acidimicrobiales bacterium]